jgi:hypothetical protein
MPSHSRNEYLEVTFSDTFSIYLLPLYLEVDSPIPCILECSACIMCRIVLAGTVSRIDDRGGFECCNVKLTAMVWLGT